MKIEELNPFIGGKIMGKGRCAAHCDCGLNRRTFLAGSAASIAGVTLLSGCNQWAGSAKTEKIAPCGPASRYTPTIKAAFVRRQEEYGMWWPGAVYDGQAARDKYTAAMQETARGLGARLDLRQEPIFSPAEADAWIAEAKGQKVDGLLVVLLDRQKHAWPTAQKAANSGVPTVIFSPLGSSFTTNTVNLADQPGCVIYCTVDDFSQAAYGMKMLCVGAKMKQTRCVVIKGNQKAESTLPDLGIQLRTIPANTFLQDYEAMGTPEEVVAMADEYMRLARDRRLATRQDVINGIKSYCVARDILRREQADAITMDCLGALGKSTVSLPCIAWSRMNDDGIPAACEADLGAVASHVVVQYLFDRPGFQQDPVPDTQMDAVIGAHCSCPTRLAGFDKKPEPFELIHHHGNRDAVPRTLWKEGQRITCLDVLLGDGRERKTELLISEGTVIDNISVPPAGGCVVSVRAKFDGGQDVLTFPGFHQLFFYGEFGNQLKDFAQLFNLTATVV
ncbi:MAG: hypothetical protein JXA82_03785 [Sedimentisphaerales bacterium]|nr:hypothetical protein [Sedimentisphaerales bacterium]